MQCDHTCLSSWWSLVPANDANVLRPGSVARLIWCLLYSSTLPALRLALLVWKLGWNSKWLIGAEPWVEPDDERDMSLRNMGLFDNGEGIRLSFIVGWYCPNSLSVMPWGPAWSPWSILEVRNSGWANADAIFWLFVAVRMGYCNNAVWELVSVARSPEVIEVVGYQMAQTQMIIDNQDHVL